MDQAKDLLSVVVPVCNEETNIDPLYRELDVALSPLGYRWEIVFVDDGSDDGSWAAITALHESDPRVKGIRFSRNFGHQHALFAGLAYARGNGVIQLDADLQHPPSLIPALVDEWKRGSLVVNTVRSDPSSIPLWKRVTSRLFYRVFSFLSGVPLRAGMADFRLLDRRVVESVLRFREQTPFLRGIIRSVGYAETTVEYESRERRSGKSKYTFARSLRFAWSGISSFSLVPLRIAVILGVVTSAAAFAELIYAVSIRIWTENAVPGWASAVSILSLLFGISFILLGVIGEYVGRILIEVRGRPRFLVREAIGVGEGGGADGEPGGR